jgi:hypothetical protein
VILSDFSSVVRCPSIVTVRPCLSKSGHSGQVAFFHGTYHPGDVSSKGRNVQEQRSGTLCNGISGLITQ